MINFNEWCDTDDKQVGDHGLRLLVARPRDLTFAEDAVAAAVPGHYLSPEHVARVLERLGKPEAAALLRTKLPTSKAIQSGDLGEILATEFIEEQTLYTVPIKRLRWKDHRNMAMRGEDVIGIRRDGAARHLRFLKSEAKSRVSLVADVVTAARQALDKDNGLPSAHALSFISEQLLSADNTELADAIDDIQLKDGVTRRNVDHFLFTLSGNDPSAHLQASLAAYTGSISQNTVGLRIRQHAEFVQTIYDKVTPDGDDR